MRKRPNLVNFFYLIGSGVFIQLAGTVYRIWLARKIGPEGLGILNMVYPVYRLLSGVATLGLPLALTKWVSEYLAAGELDRIVPMRRWAARIVLFLSLALSVLLYLCTPFLGRSVFSDPRVQEALWLIAPAIPFSALSAIYRGYFHGFSKMAPTAISEIDEQIMEIGSTYLTATYFATTLPFTLSATPVLGLTLGEVACFATLFVILKRHSSRPAELDARTRRIPRRRIFTYSWPLLVNQIVVSVSMASEGVIIPRLLIQGGVTAAMSTGLFGELSGMAEPVAYFPLLLLGPLGAVLSPQVSSAWKTRSYRRIGQKISKFFIINILICLFGFLGILIFAAPLAGFLYKSQTPVPLIRLLVIGLPFTGLGNLAQNIMVAVGATDKILKLSLWSIGLKTFMFMILVPLRGIEGAAWAINITQIFVSLASLVELKRVLQSPGA